MKGSIENLKSLCQNFNIEKLAKILFAKNFWLALERYKNGKEDLKCSNTLNTEAAARAVLS